MSCSQCRGIRLGAIRIGAPTSDVLGIFNGCAHPDAAKAVVDDTVREGRYVGAGLGLLVGFVAGFVGAAYVSSRATGRP